MVFSHTDRLSYMTLLIIWCRDSLFDYLLAHKDFLAAILLNWISSISTAAHFSSVDTELVAYLAGCKSYNKNNRLNFWMSQEPKFPLLGPFAQDLLCVPASQSYVERVFSVCGDLMSGKRNQLMKKLDNRAFLKVNYKYCAWTLLRTTFSLLQRTNVEWLTSLCNLIVAQGRIPDDWRSSTGTLLPVFKGKGDPMECGS